jgi:hypothetical protein
MKKKMFLISVFLLFGSYLFSQTWTTRQDENWDVEWRVVTREEWNRLLKQKEATYEYASLSFTDVLEIRLSTPIKGTRPPMSGYYYCIGNWQPRNEGARRIMNLNGGITSLLYGNGRTGYFVIMFYHSSIYTYHNVYYIGSDSYNRRYNQCIGWVNGEP